MIPREFFCVPFLPVHLPLSYAAPEGKCPGKKVFSRRNIHPRRRMSRKTPQNWEKPPPQKKNVPENATIPGENVVAVGKHPCFGGQTGRKCRRGGKMSRETPQNVEGISPSSKTSSFYPRNVEEITAQRKMS